MNFNDIQALVLGTFWQLMVLTGFDSS